MGGDLAQKATKEAKGIWRECRFGVFVTFCGIPRLETCWTSGSSRGGMQGWIRLSPIRLSFRADSDGWSFLGDQGMDLPNQPVETNRRHAFRFRMGREGWTLDRLPSCPPGGGGSPGRSATST
jgi:hypothetical protein